MSPSPSRPRSRSKPPAARDPRIDAYIEQAAEFARPLLRELRERVHAGCPGVVETVKWGAPSFEHHGLLGGMAAFKKHCLFGFWKHDLLAKEADEWQQLGERLGRLTVAADLPNKRDFQRLLRRAMELNEQGVKPVRAKKAKPAIAVHPAFAKALAASSEAKRHFAAFAPSRQREYLEWIAEAKAEATRERRIDQAIEWIAEGKHRNWKYERC